MRILLSPLYFCQSFCKHCIRIYYREHPEEWVWEYELERMPPLGTFEANYGFVPDFSLLTMFDEFTIAGQAYERMRRTPRSTWLGTWPEVIELLEAEGTLSIVDIDQEVKQLAAIRGGMLRRDMRNPTKWARAMAYYDALVAAADHALGSKPPAASTLMWKYDPDKLPGVRGPDGNYHILSSTPLLDPGEDPDDPHFQLHQVALDHLRSQLREVNAGLALSAKLGIVPMFWAPYQGYLEVKSKQVDKLENVSDKTEAARLFFRIAFPRFRPDTARELGRLREDKRLRQLREVIVSAAQTGEVMDPEYPQRILEEVFRVERRVGRMRQIAGWISVAIGLIPLPWLGLGTTLASELVTTVIEKNLRKDWNWFYLISDGTGHS